MGAKTKVKTDRAETRLKEVLREHIRGLSSFKESNIKMWFSAKPNLACLQAAVRKVFSAFLIISRYRFLPSLCAASDDLYSHVMNPISLVTQQKTFFMFINSLLPCQIGRLNRASHDACPAQWRWQQCALWVQRREECEQPISSSSSNFISDLL